MKIIIVNILVGEYPKQEYISYKRAGFFVHHLTQEA